MSGQIYESLQSQLTWLNTLYEDNWTNVQEIQHKLIHEILPGLVDELGLDDRSTSCTLQFLQDTPFVFRMLKRHRFTIPFAMEALRSTASWRVKEVLPLASNLSSPFLHCLPMDALDPFGRPIIILRLSGLSQKDIDLRPALIHNMELLRLHLVRLNHERNAMGCGGCPVLHYVVLLDVSGMSFNGMQHLDTLKWFVGNILPRFPGMFSAVFVLNYSWTYSGIWTLAKRLLPASSLEKVFFPSQDELRCYFSSASLPADWGGDLPSVSEIDGPPSDPVATALAKSTQQALDPTLTSMTPPPPQDATLSHQSFSPRRSAASCTSLFNPFFGYPIFLGDSSIPTLRHGRRRKRDLFATLFRLWWKRWRRHVKAGGIFAVFAVLVVMAVRRHGWQTIWLWRTSRMQRTLAFSVPSS